MKLRLSNYSGDVRNFDTEVQEPRVTAHNLTENGKEAISSAKKEYGSLHHDIGTLKNEAKEIIQHTRDEIQPDPDLKGNVLKNHDPEYSPYLRANEYMVKKAKLTIRADKFIEDAAPIKCGSKDEILSTYDFISTIGLQYGIIIQSSVAVTKWIDPTLTTFAPTFGLLPTDFDSYEKAGRAYVSMSHALATKLHRHVDFDPSFTAAKSIVHDFEKDGFKMLYDL